MGFHFQKSSQSRNPRFYLKTHFDLKVKTAPYHSHFINSMQFHLQGFFFSSLENSSAISFTYFKLFSPDVNKLCGKIRRCSGKQELLQAHAGSQSLKAEVHSGSQQNTVFTSLITKQK